MDRFAYPLLAYRRGRALEEARAPDRAAHQRRMSEGDPLLRLLSRFGEEGVEYVPVSGQAVRLNGFLRVPKSRRG